MYEPAEDSELLAQALKKYAKGKVLDIGTGSGILARTAHDKGLSVLAVDNDQAVVTQRKTEKFPVRLSDRFSKVKGTFDTIVCNPPYLPNDKEVHDPSLHGGKKGYEYILSVLREAKQHLSSDGQFLFLISTLTRPAVVEQTLRDEGYLFSIVAKEKLFMEELLVYRATLAIGEPAVLIGKGKRSLVYGTKRYAVKVSNSLRAAKEAQLLRKVNSLGIGPRYLKHNGERLYMQRIKGEPFATYVKKTKDVAVMKALLKQARALDKVRLNKTELSRPGKNVLVTKTRRVVLLDFERSIFTNKPNNVSSLATFLSRLLGRECRTAIAAYKKSLSQKDFLALNHCLFSRARLHCQKAAV